MYTHYFKSKTKHTREQWNYFIDECKKLYHNLPKHSDSAGGFHSDDPLEIADGYRSGKPVFNEKKVCFNGKGELGHETFLIMYKSKNDDFCKTARKPYDLLVVACLIAAYQILDFRFGSDGFNNDETCDDLQAGIDYYNSIIKPEILITQEILAKQRKEYYEF